MKRIIALTLSFVMISVLFVACNTSKTAEKKQGNVPVIKFFSSSMVDKALNTTDGDKTNVAFYELLEKKFNVKIETEVPPAANYNERLQIMMAGGDYPDVIAFPDHNDKSFLSAVKSGVVVPLNDYLKAAPNIMKYTSDISWKALKLKGDEKIYAIPRSSIMRADGYMLRQDWLDKLGIKLPEDGVVTLDQLTDILTRFTNDDPDGNAKKDTYGMVSFQNVAGGFEPPFIWPFGVNGWQEHKGEYEYMDETYCLEHSNYKDALSYANMLYKKGLIDPDSLVIKQGAATDRFNKGVIGMMTNFAGNTKSNYQALAQHTPTANIGYISAIKGKNGEMNGNLIGAGYYWAWAITEKSKNKETIVKMFDYMLSDEIWETVKYGFEGKNYTVENGIKKAMFDSTKKQIIMDVGKSFVRRNNDQDMFISLGMPDGLLPDIHLRSKWLDQCIKNFKPSLDLAYRPEAANNISDAQKKLTQVVSKIIVGDLPVSEYDVALKEWYKAGGKQYVEEMNGYIKKQN